MRCYKEFDKDFNPSYFEIIQKISWDPKGCSGRECFKNWDSTGIILATKEPYIMTQVMSGKSLLNLNIKIWSEGINSTDIFPNTKDVVENGQDGVFCVGELQDSFPGLPEWVWESVQGQIHRLKPSRELYKLWEFRWHVESLCEQYKVEY
ncbi:MAG: hypothetical protein ACTSUK_01725 [Promethearchaeota archaeon]